MTGVSIIGIGMHPFGRFDGVTARQQATHAVRAALKDASLEWSDVQFACGVERERDVLLHQAQVEPGLVG